MADLSTLSDTELDALIAERANRDSVSNDADIRQRMHDETRVNLNETVFHSRRGPWGPEPTDEQAMRAYKDAGFDEDTARAFMEKGKRSATQPEQQRPSFTAQQKDLQ